LTAFDRAAAPLLESFERDRHGGCVGARQLVGEPGRGSHRVRSADASRRQEADCRIAAERDAAVDPARGTNIAHRPRIRVLEIGDGVRDDRDVIDQIAEVACQQRTRVIPRAAPAGPPAAHITCPGAG
jgi:hypothetical protein